MNNPEWAANLDNFMAANINIEKYPLQVERDYQYRKSGWNRSDHAHVAEQFLEALNDKGHVFRDFYIGRIFFDGDGAPCVFLGIGCSRKYEDEKLIEGECSFGTIPVLKFLPPRVLYLGLYKGENFLWETSPEEFFNGRDEESENPIFNRWA